MAIIERKQLTGSTAKINQYAGHEGQLVFDKTTKHLHVLSGTAGKSTKIANVSDIPAPVDISGKADRTYVDTGLAGKANSSHTHTSVQITDLNTTISNTLRPYATTNTVNTELDKKANKSHTHTVSQITDMPKVVLSVNRITPASDGNVALGLHAVATSGNYNDLSNKPSIPATPKAYVTETWHSGTSWYRKWSDGWLEQGGRVNAVGYNNKTQNVTFMVTMSNTNYFAVSNPLDTMHATWDLSSRVSLLKMEGMTVRGSTNADSIYTGGCTWYVCGY